MTVHNRGSLNTLATKVFAASLIAVPVFSRAFSAQVDTDEDAIRALNAGYVRAFMKSDSEWYDRHLTPDFMCILTSGAVVDRSTFLENARKPHTTISYDLSEIKIRVHGDVALVSALGTWERKDGTRGRTRYVDVWVRKDGTRGRTRYVDVWVRKDGAWKAVSAQLTALPGAG